MEILPDLIVLCTAFYFCVFRKLKDRSLRAVLPGLLFFLYIILVFNITLMPFFTRIPDAFSGSHSFNLRPYIDLILRRGDYKRQIVLNILMFVPFGILFPAVRKASFVKTVLYGGLFSLMIEILQFLFSTRIADITDLINNTAGAFIGAVLWFVLLKPFVSLFVHEDTAADKLPDD